MYLRTARRGSRSVSSKSAYSGPSSLADVVASRLREVPDLPEQAAGLACELGEPVRPEDEHGDHEDHRELGQTDSEHG